MDLMRVVLWGLLASAPALGGLAFADATRLPRQSVPQASAPAFRRETRVMQSTDSLATVMLSLAPFRASRRSAAVRYDPTREAVASVPIGVRPTLQLRGILWGTRPGAVIEGVSGSSGDHLFAPGDNFGGLRVRRIERNQVTIDGFDTTWVLRLPPPAL